MRALAGVFIAGAASSCAAEPGVAIQGGRYESIETIGLQVTLDDWFRAERSGWRVVGYPELQVNRHEQSGDELVQGGVFATFRVDPAHARMRPYLEAGLGANVFSRGNIGSKDFGTRFQFGELIGIGIAWGGNTGGANETWIGVRFTHYSNAGIKKPNPGLEALQLVIGHRF
ncbi:acyloxyacyl hydrolase [Aromatoleum sp.]|uniref:acyloxyacyl hydrolase n=1 Tax=Aromatoleum sp. TaxID=2307007 RepID=UPI002FC9E581